MARRFAATVAFCLILIPGVSLFAAGTVMVSLTSPQANTSVAPGQPIHWRMEADVSDGDNAGLALILVDLVQSVANPQTFDLVAPTEVPSAMQKFAAPSGFANPNGGYTGHLDGAPGAWNVRQIGGAQNSFGQAGLSIGQVVDVDAGVGQSSPVLIAKGSFPAPPTPGVYSVFLENIFANTFDTINTPPTASPVSPAGAFPADAGITFTVDDTIHLRADLNCDGAVNGLDVAPFALALLDGASYEASYPSCELSQADVNDDSQIDTNDIAAFVDCLLSGCS